MAADALPADRTPASAPPVTPARILLVDDDPLALELSALLLEDAFPDAALTARDDPAAALALFGRETFDVVVLDFDMPGLNGLECARRMQAIQPYLPIILCTGAGDEMLAARAMQSGLTDYLPKAAMSAQSLHRAITRALEATRQARTIDDQRRDLELFAHALAHDFKQPVRQLLTFSQLIADEAAEAATPELAQHIVFLRRAAERLGALVEVMSQYTLLNAAPEIHAVDLDQAFEAAREALSVYIADRGAQVTATAPLGVVQGNDALARQVFQNLIHNGLKYNESATPSVEVSLAPGESGPVAAFRDNGIGIAPEHQEAIFQPMKRLHSASQYAGSGIGLSIVRKAMTLQGGQVTCASTPGDGSVFSVRFQP